MKLDYIHLMLQAVIHLLPLAYYVVNGGAMPMVSLVAVYIGLFTYDAWHYLPAKGRVNGIEDGEKKPGLKSPAMVANSFLLYLRRRWFP